MTRIARTCRWFLPIVAIVTCPTLATAQDLSPADLQAEVERLKVSEQRANARADALEERLKQLEMLLGVGAAGDGAMASMRARAVPRLQGEWFGDAVIPMRSSLAAAQPSAQTGVTDGLEAEEPERKSPAPVTAVEDVTRKEQAISATASPSSQASPIRTSTMPGST